MSERVELELDGDRGEIGAAVVRDSLSDTIKLLDAAAHSLEVEPPRWKIERLDLASVHAGLESPQNLGIVPLIWHGLEDLRERVVLHQERRSTMSAGATLGRRAPHPSTTLAAR